LNNGLSEEDKEKLKDILGYTNEYRDGLLEIILNNQAIVENIKKEITKHEDYLKIKKTLWLVSHEVCSKELQLLNRILDTTYHSKSFGAKLQ